MQVHASGITQSHKHMKKLILPILFLLITLPHTEARLWIGQDGRVIEGDLIDADDHNVSIRKMPERTKLTIRIANFSEAGRYYIKKFVQKKIHKENIPTIITALHKGKYTTITGDEAKDDDDILTQLEID